MAALLHYIFLVDFALMLAEGVELTINVFFVFEITSSRTKWLIPACWVAPAVIVGISMGATKLDGYGNSQYCWFSIESKLIWTFAGPVLTIILINFVILILVMKKITSDKTRPSQAKKKKTTTEQVKAGIRKVCIILPLFGVTWVLGAFSINEETVVFQYLFAVFNSLQGFFIFLMNIVLDKQVREGIHKIRKQKADKSSTYSQKNTTKESSVPSTGLGFTDIEKSKTHATGPINSIANNKYSHQMNNGKDNDTAPIHFTTPTDVPGPITNYNTKESKRKSRLDKDDKKLKQSDHRRDVVFQRSHKLAPGKQNHDGGHINQRVQRRTQYNSRPENNIAYYHNRPVMPYGEAWWPYVGNYQYPFGYERQRRPYEYHHQRGNTFSWSADC
ncbi:uncharacterized protein LOC143047880 [Mytilus galloprovincialis]|uniref:uncharacterized protein LOC143047880 n=1 Tax=Mytilus galloprovincialis TaxID=29158 RepID=UPI003F7B746C